VRERLKRVPGLVPLVHSARAARSHAAQTQRRVAFAHNTPRRNARIRAYLASHDVRRLQLGTGKNPYEGWLNTDVVDYTGRGEDVVYMDALKPFPLPDASFDSVFSEHMLEHASYAQGQHVLRECHRILRPGGRIRIATPGVDNLIRLYANDLSDLQERYIRWSIDTFAREADAYLPGFVLNNMFFNFAHRFVYDRETLRHALEAAGYADVEERAIGESADPELRGRERHMRRAAEFNAYETIVLEARRP
jgi:predicted SAM-dependent methyltransferase